MSRKIAPAAGVGVWAALACAMVAAGAGHAQDSSDLMPVYVESDCDADPVGVRLVYRVREGIRRSAAMRLANGDKSSVIQFSIVCLDPGADDRNIVSNYGYVINLTNPDGFLSYNVTHGVGVCGSSQIDSCGDGLVARIDKTVSDLRKLVPD